MKLIIDDANIEAIKKLYEYYPCDGVTTNPTIISRTGKDPYEVLEEIRKFIGEDELHVQAVSLTAEGIIQEAHEITKRLGKNTYVKIPCFTEGFKAMKILHKEGVKITGTVVLTPMQALLAAKCGASYVAPYVNRMDNMGYDGVLVTQKIQDMFDAYGYETEILGASFRNSNQVIELAQYGIASCTCAPDIIKNFVNSPTIDATVNKFVSDFEKLVGEGKTMTYKK